MYFDDISWITKDEIAGRAMRKFLTDNPSSILHKISSKLLRDFMIAGMNEFVEYAKYPPANSETNTLKNADKQIESEEALNNNHNQNQNGKV
jgi:hypothetical protein